MALYHSLLYPLLMALPLPSKCFWDDATSCRTRNSSWIWFWFHFWLNMHRRQKWYGWCGICHTLFVCNSMPLLVLVCRLAWLTLAKFVRVTDRPQQTILANHANVYCCYICMHPLTFHYYRSRLLLKYGTCHAWCTMNYVLTSRVH